MAQENPGQTLQSTALVHEACIRPVDVEKAQRWGGRRHFFAAAAEAMRRILVENAHRKGRPLWVTSEWNCPRWTWGPRGIGWIC
jgi:hypothetical protein